MSTHSLPHTTPYLDLAREIARDWQSSGSVGSHLAALASGAAVDLDDLAADVEATINHEQPTGLDLASLRWLSVWVATLSH